MTKYIYYIIVLCPFLTKYIESKFSPDKPRFFITDVGMTIVIAILLTILYKRERFIENLSRHDHLTGISNRRQFDFDIQQEVLRAKRTKRGVCLIFFDLNEFKQVNDKYAHAEGDNILIQFSQRLSSFIREGTDFCYRFGGDDFAVLLTNINNNESINTFSDLEDHLQRSVYRNLQYGVSASEGIVFLNKNETHQHFFKRADETMYKVKEERRLKLIQSDAKDVPLG